MRVKICRAICKWSACGLGKSPIDQMADLRPKWPFCRWRNLLAKHAIFFQMAIWCKWPFAPPNGPFGPVAKRTLSFYHSHDVSIEGDVEVNLPGFRLGV